MKILLVHNFYGSSAPSGENTAYLAEKDLLQNQGHEVIEFIRSSDQLRNQGFSGIIQGGLTTPWNPIILQKVRNLLKNEHPDIMHVHNTFPLISPAVFHAAAGLKTATVFTLHNYRVFCAAAIPMRNTLPCTECLDQHSIFPALKYGCYRNSRLATLPLIGKIALHRRLKTWSRHVDAFITLTEFQRIKMVEAGLPKEHTHIKPHFYPEPIPVSVSWSSRKPQIVFIGRLSPEKGVHVLINAWKQWGNTAPKLDIIGDGPERLTLEKMICDSEVEPRIRFRGQLPFSQVQEELSYARLLILPSLCYEGFPMTIREAFALGVPVAASRLGAIPYIVSDHKNGILFSPGNSEALCRRLKALWDSPELPVMADNARKEFERKYTAKKNHQHLMEIYQAAIAVRQRRK